MRTLLLILILAGAGRISAQTITPELLAQAKKVCKARQQMDSIPGYAGDKAVDSVKAIFFSELESFLAIPGLPLLALTDSLCVRHVKSPDGRFVIFSIDERMGGTFRSYINYEVTVDSTGLHYYSFAEYGGGELGIVKCDTIQFQGKVFYFFQYWSLVSSYMAKTEIMVTDETGKVRESISLYSPWYWSGSRVNVNEYDPLKKRFHHQHAESVQYGSWGQRDFTRLNKDGLFNDSSGIRWDQEGCYVLVREIVDLRKILEEKWDNPEDDE